tara:strand:+ start:371 stop:1279 length:909 start_codon:yes stop_codon:yes gene_type:complete
MNNKLIVRISEGLGNQLFMYSNAYTLSKKINYDLFIDDESSYMYKNIRSYLLNNFHITGKIVNNNLKFNNYGKNIIRKLKIKIDKYKKHKEFLIEAKDTNKQTSYYDYHSNILLNKNTYLEGHFESEKYFINDRYDILNEFKLINENQFKNNKYLYGLRNENIVSICVRQNRFSERPSNKSNLQSIEKSKSFVKETIEYIKRAETLIESKISNPKYFIWSDDFTNLREYFPKNKYTFIINDENKILNDFYLLKNCKYFIVGPTTFHWWGAWLSNFDNKICIRPKNLNPSSNSDFWPESWPAI